MKILVAVDSSRHSREAIQFVRSVRWPEKSKIHLINVIEMKHAPPLVPSDGPSSWDRVIAQARGKLVTEARRFLEDMKKEILKKSPITIHPILVEGLPGSEILQAAKDNDIDLIVLGTRGLSPVKRFLLGSTSAWVMREASCSVLLVREKLSKMTTGKTAAKVILATDGSAEALQMVDMLRLLKCRIPPKVTVTHVVGRPAFLEGWYWGKGKAEFLQLAEQIQTKAEEDGVSHLETMRQMVHALHLKVDTALLKGDPADEVIKTAERLKAKLIIVGSKGFKRGKPVPLGGIVRKISRYAPCSVLLTRPGQSEKGG